MLGREVAEQRSAPVVEAPAEEAPIEEPPTEEAPEESAEATEAAPTKAPLPPSPLDEDRLIADLTEQKRGLLRRKGEQAREIGDLRQVVAQQQQLLEALQQAQATRPLAPLPQMSREELVTKLLDAPDEIIPQIMAPLVQKAAREQAEQLLAEKASAWQQQATEEQSALAPEVGKDLFLARHEIKGDFDTWLGSTEGQAVNDIVERDPARTRLLSAYVEDADARGIANVLTKALEAHRIGKRAATARHAVNGEKARVEAAKPPSLPPRSAIPPPLTPPRGKSLYDKDFSDADLMDFMKGADRWERED